MSRNSIDIGNMRKRQQEDALDDKILEHKQTEYDKLQEKLKETKISKQKLLEEQIAAFKYKELMQRKVVIDQNVGVSMVDNPFLMRDFETSHDDDDRRMNTETAELENIREKEFVSAQFIAHLPADFNMFNSQLPELDYVSNMRSDAEKKYLEANIRENDDFVDGGYDNLDRRRSRIKGQLKRALMDDDAPRKDIIYNPYNGFVLHLDFQLHIHRLFDVTSLSFEIFDDEKIVFKEKMTIDQALDCGDDGNTFKRMYGEMYKIYSQEPTDKTFVLFKVWIEEIFEVENVNEFDNLDDVFAESIDDPVPFYKEKVVYGWCPVMLFYKKDLIKGRYKQPLYKTPVPEKISFENLKSQPILNYGDFYIRTEAPDPNLTTFMNESNNEGKFDAKMATEAYYVPGYLQTHEGEPEIDEYEEARLEQRRRRDRFELALNKKNLRDKLREREKLIKEQHIGDEENYYKVEVDKFIAEQENNLANKLSEMNNEKKDLEARMQDLEADIAAQLRARAEREENLRRITGLRKGIRIVFNRVRNIATYDEVKVVAGIFVESEGQMDDLGERCVVETAKQVDHIPAEQRLRKSKPPSIKIDFIDEVHEQVKNTEGLFYLWRNKKKVYQGLQVVRIEEKISDEIVYKEDEKKEEFELNIKQEVPEVQHCEGWVWFEIGRPDGTLRKGKQNEKLMKPPVLRCPFDKKKVKLSTTALEFTIEIFDYDFDSLAIFAERRRPPKKKKLKFKKVEAVAYEPNYAAFIPNKIPKYSNRPFIKGSGIDIYVDCCRFLPDNVTFTKQLFRVVDSDQKDLISIQAGMPDLDTDIFNPEFNFRQELRAPNFDPTLMLYVQFLTIDSKTADKVAYQLGYCVFPLFINKRTEQQPKTRAEYADSILQDGYYQLPIYCQNMIPNTPFYVDSLEGIDKLPGSSCLVRIRLAPTTDDATKVLGLKDIAAKDREKYAVWIKSIPYSSGFYNNATCGIRASDYELFKMRQKREAIDSREKSKDIMAMQEVYIEDEQNKAKNVIDDEIFDFMDNQLEYKTSTELLDLKYFSKYSSKGGFKFAIDGIFNTPSNGFFTCLYTLNPPASFYNPLEDDNGMLKVNTRFDWECSVNRPIYNENFVKFGDMPFNPFQHFVIEVRQVKIRAFDEPEIIKVGWTILPIFTTDGYVNSNIYQLPIFQGELNYGVIEKMVSYDPWVTIQQMVKKGAQKYKGKTSVICRLLDSQREGHFNLSFDADRIKKTYLPQNNINSYLYTNADFESDKSGKRLRDIIPYNEDPVSFNEKITNACTKEFKMA